MRCAYATRHGRGFTLIEVVAALALMATTMVGLLLAQAGAMEQYSAMRERRSATQLAGELITKWQVEGQRPTPPAEGRFDSPDRLEWTLQYHTAPIDGLVGLRLAVRRMGADGLDPVAALAWWELARE